MIELSDCPVILYLSQILFMATYKFINMYRNWKTLEYKQITSNSYIFVTDFTTEHKVICIYKSKDVSEIYIVYI